VIEENSTCFIVRDANGQALGYLYFEDEPGQQTASKHKAPRMSRSCRSASEG
jgi:hypothetical protein